MTGVNTQVGTTNSGVSFTGFGNILYSNGALNLYTISWQMQSFIDGLTYAGINLSVGVTGTVTAFTAIDYGATVFLATLPSTYSNVTSITGNSIINIGGTGVTNTSPLLTSVSFPKLTYCNGGGFSPVWASLTTLNLTSLKMLATAFSPTLAACTTLTLPALQYVGTSFALSAAVLTTLSLPALLKVFTTFAITAANMTTFSMNTGLLSIGGNFTMTGMKLNQASVDGILVSLAALDGTGGTTAYSGFTVNLSGGTSSAPSATGVAAAATLTGRGCTVTTN